MCIFVVQQNQLCDTGDHTQRPL